MDPSERFRERFRQAAEAHLKQLEEQRALQEALQNVPETIQDVAGVSERSGFSDAFLQDLLSVYEGRQNWPAVEVVSRDFQISLRTELPVVVLAVAGYNYTLPVFIRWPEPAPAWKLSPKIWEDFQIWKESVNRQWGMIRQLQKDLLLNNVKHPYSLGE